MMAVAMEQLSDSKGCGGHATIRLLHTPFLWIMASLRAMQGAAIHEIGIESSDVSDGTPPVLALVGDKTFDTSQCAEWKA